MAKLPIDLCGREVRVALERAGFVFRRQSGSHMILRRGKPHTRVVVPDHKQIRAGTLRRIIADAGSVLWRLRRTTGIETALFESVPPAR